jgi:hypothetical protein
MSHLQLTQAYVELFHRKKRTLKREHFRKFLESKKRDAKCWSEDFRHSDAKLTSLRSGHPVDESFARTLAAFVLEIRDGESPVAREANECKTYDYTWTHDFHGMSQDEALSALFVPPHTQAFAGSFKQVVQDSISIIHDLAYRIGMSKPFRLDENHAWMSDSDDAVMTANRMNCSYGSHFHFPEYDRNKLTDDQMLELATANWGYHEIALSDWEYLYRRWHEIYRYVHVWAVKSRARATIRGTFAFRIFRSCH